MTNTLKQWLVAVGVFLLFPMPLVYKNKQENVINDPRYCDATLDMMNCPSDASTTTHTRCASETMKMSLYPCYEGTSYWKTVKVTNALFGFTTNKDVKEYFTPGSTNYEGRSPAYSPLISLIIPLAAALVAVRIAKQYVFKVQAPKPPKSKK